MSGSQITDSQIGKPSSSGVGPEISPHWRAGILFLNFFLIILAYYQIKPASRSLFIEYLGADRLPYVWIGTAVFLGSVIGFYHRLVERHSRLNVVLGTCLVFFALLVLFRILLAGRHAAAAIAFYIFVDIFSVVLVEQFWSLTNTIYRTEEGKRWYGFVGTGGLAGGVVAGAAAKMLLERTAMTTEDLLLVSAAILALIFALNLFMGHLGVYREMPGSERPVVAKGGWRTLIQSRYLLLIAAILLLAQLAQPIVEYQFLKSVEAAYRELDSRTAYISWFFSVLGLVSIGVNLVVTPLVHRFLGVIAGLLAQPVLLCLFAFAFMLQPVLLAAATMKISDRGLSYSINRASKELLYIPVDPVHTYQAKAWIDMFGYRLFKVLGSVMILLLTQWLPVRLSVAQFSWITMLDCVVWIGAVVLIAGEYRRVTAPPVSATVDGAGLRHGDS